MARDPKDLDEDYDDEDEEESDCHEDSDLRNVIKETTVDQKTPLKYTMTNESITVVDGGRTFVVRQTQLNFAALHKAILGQDWAAARNLLEVKTSVKHWASGHFAFSEDERQLLFQGQPVPENIYARIMDMVRKNESPRPLFRFYERLQGNPSFRSVQQLFNFLLNVGIPITPDGCFLTYKGVNDDYTDVHSRICEDKNCGHQTYDNRPGNTHQMPRNCISDDPQVACHVGFHVGSIAYAQDFGPRVVICKIDPADVVCVPYDCTSQKMRVCKYSVVGHYGEKLPDTLFAEEIEVPAIKADQFGDLPSTEELMAMPIDELRRVAVQDLKIVGAGHIKGGKTAVVAAILAAVAGQGIKER